MIDRGQSAQQVRLSEQEIEDAEREDAATAAAVTRFQSGDGTAFTELYDRYFDRVYAYLRVALEETQEAEDATQQVFVKVFEALPSYEQRAQPWRAWLFRITRNLALDQLRQRGRVEVEEPAEIDRRREPAHVDFRALHWTSDDDLMLLIERLPQMQRQVLTLRYILDFNAREIGEILERTPEAIRQLQRRALLFLEERLVALGREPAERKRRLAMTACGRRGALRSEHSFTLARL